MAPGADDLWDLDLDATPTQGNTDTQDDAWEDPSSSSDDDKQAHKGVKRKAPATAAKFAGVSAVQLTQEESGSGDGGSGDDDDVHITLAARRGGDRGGGDSASKRARTASCIAAAAAADSVDLTGPPGAGVDWRAPGGKAGTECSGGLSHLGGSALEAALQVQRTLQLLRETRDVVEVDQTPEPEEPASTAAHGTGVAPAAAAGAEAAARDATAGPSGGSTDPHCAGGGEAGAAAGTSDFTRVKLVFRTLVGGKERSVAVSVVDSEPLSRAFDRFTGHACDQGWCPAAPGAGRFVFDGDCLTGRETPQDLDMEDDCVVDVYW